MPQINRNVAIASGVVLFHVAALWALQTGLLRKAVEIVVPVEMLSQIIAPPAPPAPPAPEPPPVPPPPAPPPPPPSPAPAPVKPPPPAPAPLPQGAPAPAQGPVATFGPFPDTAAAPAASAASAPAAAPPPAPAPPPAAGAEGPVVDADYAPNESLFRPPAISVRMGEYGTVLLTVTVGVNGFATRVELARSSGFRRLDAAALDGARKLKFKPAMKNGAPVEATYDLPVKYSEPKT